MYIIHGEDIATSYKNLTELLNSYKPEDHDVIIKDASELEPTQLRQELSSSNLFGTNKLLVIKNLLGGTRSKQKEILIKILSGHQNSNTILYEVKKIPEASLKNFSESKIETYMVNPVIFKFLDHLRPGNSKNLLNGWNRLLELKHEPEYVFAMLVRQIRLLIQAKSGPSYLKLSPYPKKNDHFSGRTV